MSNKQDATVTLNFRTSDLDELKRIAKMIDVSVSHVIRTAIKEYIYNFKQDELEQKAYKRYVMNNKE